MSKLAIIDWGIGGVGVRKAIFEACPEISVTYFSDTGVTAYGKMGRKELARRLDQVIAYLGSLGATHIVVGCNAASTAIPYLATTEAEIEGIIDVGVAVAISNAPARLGVIGGRRTILSGAYRQQLALSRVVPLQRIAQPLSALIEMGDVGSQELTDQCRRLLRPLRHCSHILLACTHYSAITGVMSRFVAPETVFLDPAPALAVRVSRWNIDAGGTDRFLTTGDAGQMKRSALSAFRWSMTNPKTVSL